MTTDAVEQPDDPLRFIKQFQLHWMLDDAGEPVVEPDLMTWARWLEDSRTKRVILQERHHGAFISTVFLALDHNFGGYDGVEPHVPILWETMIFGGPFNDWQERYSSKLDALVGHARCVALVEAYTRVPRRTKKALGKICKYPSLFGRRERRLAARVLRRLGIDTRWTV